MNTTNPKQITLKEFEELTVSFVLSHYGVSCSSNRTLAKEFLSSFKAFAFKEELDKESRRKEYEKAKEDYLKLKDEFEFPTDLEPVTKITLRGIEYIGLKERSPRSCVGCAFIQHSDDCVDSCDIEPCSQRSVVWVKK